MASLPPVLGRGVEAIQKGDCALYGGLQALAKPDEIPVDVGQGRDPRGIAEVPGAGVERHSSRSPMQRADLRVVDLGRAACRSQQVQFHVIEADVAQNVVIKLGWIRPWAPHATDQMKDVQHDHLSTISNGASLARPFQAHV